VEKAEESSVHRWHRHLACGLGWGGHRLEACATAVEKAEESSATTTTTTNENQKEVAR
jgi:hypothetical protein